MASAVLAGIHIKHIYLKLIINIYKTLIGTAYAVVDAEFRKKSTVTITALMGKPAGKRRFGIQKCRAQTGLQMIEFKGFYHPSTHSEAVVVLVQYDGLRLHVWHLAEPFHRLVTSDQFHIALSFVKTRQTIMMSNGGRIETDDRDAVKQLSQINKTFSYDHHTCADTTNWIIAIVGTMVLFFSAWCLATNRVPF
ncbi:MAG: hypothetical protein WAU91_08880 [Desulfatitalea sp.]